MKADRAGAAAFVATLCVLSAAPACANAATEVNIEGPDQLILASPANLSNTSLNRATVETRDLGTGGLNQLLGPIIRSALEECKADIRTMTLRAANSPDRIGGTATRFGGLGIYANLASNDRTSTGNWFIAPFFYFEGSVTTASGATEPIELFEVSRIYLQPNDRTTQEDFFKARTQDAEASLGKFAAAQLPKAVKSALASHCGAQPK